MQTKSLRYKERVDILQVCTLSRLHRVTCADVSGNHHNWGLRPAECVFNRRVEALDCLEVFHCGMLDALRIATGAGGAEFLETHC